MALFLYSVLCMHAFFINDKLTSEKSIFPLIFDNLVQSQEHSCSFVILYMEGRVKCTAFWDTILHAVFSENYT